MSLSIFIDLECTMVIHHDFDDANFIQPDFCREEEELNAVSQPNLISVKGRLCKCISAWKDINAPKFIVDIIRQGYKIPFICDPEPFKGANNASALKEHEFVESSINDLLALGCILEVHVEPKIVNPLSVSINKSGKKRLILDLRHINKCIFKNKFRCEDISIAKEILNPAPAGSPPAVILTLLCARYRM